MADSSKTESSKRWKTRGRVPQSKVNSPLSVNRLGVASNKTKVDADRKTTRATNRPQSFILAGVDLGFQFPVYNFLFSSYFFSPKIVAASVSPINRLIWFRHYMLLLFGLFFSFRFLFIWTKCLTVILFNVTPLRFCYSCPTLFFIFHFFIL